MVVASEVTKGDYKAVVFYDEDPQNPRDNDNLGRMVCSHRRYRLGDNERTLGFTFNAGNFDGWEDVEKWLYDEQDALETVSMSMTDHSGLFIQAGRVRDWDSGQIGFAYITNAAAKEAWPELSGVELVERARQLLLAEIEEYAEYVEGNVFAWEVQDKDGNHLDSCHGYIGREGAKEAMNEAMAVIGYYERKATENT